MKTLALLASLAFGVALFTTGAYALPVTPGASAQNDAIVQVKHKKHKKSHKKMDQNNDSAPPEGGGKGM